MTRYFWNMSLYARISSREHVAPRVISSTILGLIEMSILMHGGVTLLTNILPRSFILGVFNCEK
jgi:hypothetical protein